MLVRLLDAFVWKNHGEHLPIPHQRSNTHICFAHLDRQETHQLGFTYVQGMNVLAAPFLYTMPSELEAFYCFSKFIEECCPLYVQPTLEGVHRGLKVSCKFFLMLPYSDPFSLLQLLDRCLKIVDPELFAHLRSKNLSAEIYAFPCMSKFFSKQSVLLNHALTAVLTLCACTPPLDQVLQLWDFLLAFGVHLSILCVIAQLLLMRDDVMKSSRLVFSPSSRSEGLLISMVFIVL